jgi:hypothetical protein
VVVALSETMALRRMVKQLTVLMLQQYTNAGSCTQTGIVVEDITLYVSIPHLLF